MSCLTCSNCGFVNFLPPEPQPQILKTIQSSDSGLVPQLLRGSRPFLNDDYDLISTEIVKLERLQSLYDAQLQEIESRRRPILKSMENRKSIYTPIRCVPRDVLLEIFHSVCDSSWQSTNDYSRKRKQHSLNMNGPLWVLGRACGLWRDTLHTSPVSWARNVVANAPFSEHALQILRFYLSRTSEHPLNIKIVHNTRKPSNDGEIMSLLL
ncbi:hypothetical protein EDD18DRAFT_206414 [Armillaria luteobubalina]|uniref:F-box domain-containing protein n=1 Tax=Armillaria luteobubalina TaxID=153913 RepID=A0AA39UNC3_9AGAR|nr:hypothetical protein EDD18DRAFT_206414 [Armillaria luteobubalina]